MSYQSLFIITIKWCRAEYLLVTVDDDDVRKTENDEDFRRGNDDDDFRKDNDDFRQPKNDCDFRKDDDDFKKPKNDDFRGKIYLLSNSIYFLSQNVFLINKIKILYFSLCSAHKSLRVLAKRQPNFGGPRCFTRWNESVDDFLGFHTLYDKILVSRLS